MIRLTYLLQFGVCTTAHVIILWAWHALIGRRASPVDAGIRALLAMSLLWVQIVVVVLLLGLTGALTRLNVVFVNLCLAAILAAVALSRSPERLRDRSVRTPGATRRGLWRHSAVAGAALFAGLGFAWYVALAVAFPPLGYDDLAYHLPSVAFFLQQGSLSPFVLPDRLAFVNAYPQATEFLSVWCFSLLGSDAMIGLWQTGVYVYFVTACFVLCRACGCTVAGTVFGLSLTAVTPTLLGQLLTTYSDAFVAANFAAALAFAVHAGRSLERATLLGLALACGALLSTKLSTPLLVIAALTVFGGIAVSRRVAMSRLVPSIAFVVLVASAIGGYWYLRNVLTHGNPLYPFKVEIGSLALPGRFDASSWSAQLLNPELSQLPLLQRLWRLWLEQKSHYGYWFYNYDSAFAGFGPIWFILGLPSIVSAFALALAQRRWTVVTVVAVSVMTYLGFGGNISVRYTLFVLPAMALGVAVMVDQLQGAVGRGKGLHAATARWTLGGVHALGLTLVVLTCGLMVFAIKDREVVRRQMLTATVTKVDVDSIVLDSFKTVRRMLPHGSVLVFDETVDFIYPLWRPDFGNQVHFLSSDQPVEQWRARASALNARYLFAKVTPTGPASARSGLAVWIDEHPADVRLVVTVPNYGELYELF